MTTKTPQPKFIPVKSKYARKRVNREFVKYEKKKPK